MSECGLCEREMMEAKGCVPHTVVLHNGDEIDAPRHDADGSLASPEGGRCHDCGAKPGGRHHAGCDWARTPDGGQLLASVVAYHPKEDGQTDGPE